MGRPKGGKNRVYTYDFKLLLMSELEGGSSSYYLGKKHNIESSTIRSWARIYRELGPESLRTKRKPGNPNAGKYNKIFESEEERLRNELALKDVEIMKLKKLIELQRKEVLQKK